MARFTDSQWAAAAEVAADMRQHGSCRFKIGQEVRFTRASRYQRDSWIECSEPLTEEVKALADAIASFDNWDILCAAKVERKSALERLNAQGIRS